MSLAWQNVVRAQQQEPFRCEQEPFRYNESQHDTRNKFVVSESM